MLITISRLSTLRKKFKKRTIVFAGGTFDLFHRGHIDALKALANVGDIVVIAVSSDKRVRQRKGRDRPILNQRERALLVDSIRWVDYTLIAPRPSHKTPIPTMVILNKLRPDIFVSSDQRWLLFQKDVKDLGVRLKIVPRIHINSTTRIIFRIIKAYGKKRTE